MLKGKKSKKKPTLMKTNNPAKLPLGRWKDALLETKNAIKDKDLTTLATSLAYYGTFAFFPTLAAFIAGYSLAVSPEQLTNTVTTAERYLPPEIADVISSQLTALTKQENASLIAAIISISIALFAASGGMQNMIKNLNKAFNVEETRGFIKTRLISIALMLAGIITLFPLLALLALNANALNFLGAGSVMVMIVPVLRWVLVAIIVTIALAVLYRFGPNRKQPTFEILSWGAAIATIIWLIGTALFSFYLQKLSNFQESYGVFAGIIAMLLWFNLSAFIILLGAIINYRLEKKTQIPFLKKN